MVGPQGHYRCSLVKLPSINSFSRIIKSFVVNRTIALFTDFGSQDIYVGQLHAMAKKTRSDCSLVDLFHDVKGFDIFAGASLLAAMLDYLPHDAIVVGVVDPGVGGGRLPIAVEIGDRWLVGPDNGLFSRSVAWSTSASRYWTLEAPINIAKTFHGRDVFLPAAIQLAAGELNGIRRVEEISDISTHCDAEEIDGDDHRVIHVDHYGNLISGLRGAKIAYHQTVVIAGRSLAHADHYECVPTGECFWYVNSIGLLEISANQASAAFILGVKEGAEIVV
jgi:hypothetical protein